MFENHTHWLLCSTAISNDPYAKTNNFNLETVMDACKIDGSIEMVLWYVMKTTAISWNYLNTDWKIQFQFCIIDNNLTDCVYPYELDVFIDQTYGFVNGTQTIGPCEIVCLYFYQAKNKKRKEK